MGCAFQSVNNRGREMKAKMKKLIKRVEAMEELLSGRSTTGLTGDGCIDETLQVRGVIDKYAKQNTYIDKRKDKGPVNVGRYKPEVGSSYWVITNIGDIKALRTLDNYIHEYNISIGNCYRTKQEAEQARLRHQALVRVNDRIDELNNGGVADYNGYQYAISGIIEGDVDITVLFKITPVSIFNTLCSVDKARTLISEMEEDIKLAAGWT